MGKLLSEDNEFKPWFDWFQWHYPQQRDLIDAISKYWEIVFIGGNGSGKTIILYWNIVGLALGLHPAQRVIGPPPLKIKVLVNSFEQGMYKVAKENLFDSTFIKKGTRKADGTILKENIEIGPLMPNSMVESMWSKEDRTLYLRNGSAIHFQTSEQRKKLHSGTTFDILACDEEPEYAPYDESKRGLRNAKGDGRIIHAFTPFFLEGQGPTWTKEALLERAESGKGEMSAMDDEGNVLSDLKELKVIRACMRDNPAVTPAYIERFKEGKTEEEIRVQLYGDYPSWGKMVHKVFEDRIWDPKKTDGHLLPKDFKVPFDDPDVYFEMAVDWHPSKPTAAIWTYTDRDGNVYIWDETKPEEVGGKTVAQLADIFYEIEGGRGRNIRIARKADPKMKDKNHGIIHGFCAWDHFRQNGIRLTEAYNRDPETGVSIVNEYFRGNMKDHPRIFIKEDCENIRRALRNHYWKKHGELFKPDGKWSDYPICLRYILQDRRKQVKKNKKKGMYFGRRDAVTVLDYFDEGKDPYAHYRRR